MVNWRSGGIAFFSPVLSTLYYEVRQSRHYMYVLRDSVLRISDILMSLMVIAAIQY